jgi:FAD/FMN-containing dehydrogenase
MTDELFAHGKRTYIKAGFARELTDELVATLERCGAGIHSPLSQIEVLAMGGAIARVPIEATAFAQRDAAWLINLPAMWEDPRDTAREMAWARDSFAALSPHLMPGRYVNFMDADEEPGATGAYGVTWERLRAVKRAYDPGNIFRLNQNIRP